MISLMGEDSEVAEGTAGAANNLKLTWPEKYRGKDLDSLILPEKIDKLFRFAIEQDTVGNYIFYSAASGTGKSSLARAIPEMLNVDYKFLYGKRDAEIMEIIDEYGMYSSPDGRPRFVIIDEADKANNPDKFYRFLQSNIEDSKSTLRFILTCNEFWRFPAAIVSRCTPIEFVVPDEEISDYQKRLFKHLMGIARKETMTCPDADRIDKNTVARIMYENFPDIRRMLGVMESCYQMNGGKIKGNPPQLPNQVIEDIYGYIIKFDAVGLRRYISRNVPFPQGVYRPFGDYAVDHLPEKIMIPFGISLANAMARASRQVDQEISLWGFCLEVMSLLQKAG